MNHKRVEKIVQIPRKAQSTGLSVAQINHRLLGEYLDPYLMFDHFEMAQPYFPPHPHAGFSAVTYMLPGSKNGFINRDSLGNRNEIGPGAIHWTVAGRGVVHEEVPQVRGIICEGLQIFVNLHSSKKFTEPYALHADEVDIPKVRFEKSLVRVVVGEYQGVRSSLEPPVEVQLLDVELKKGGVFEHTVPAGYKGFIYALSGEGMAKEPGNVVAINEKEAAGLSQEGERIEVEATNSDFYFLVAMGKPLNEPVVFHGPFCMNTTEQIARAMDDYQNGRMGFLEPSF